MGVSGMGGIFLSLIISCFWLFLFFVFLFVFCIGFDISVSIYGVGCICWVVYVGLCMLEDIGFNINFTVVTKFLEKFKRLSILLINMLNFFENYFKILFFSVLEIFYLCKFKGVKSLNNFIKKTLI